MMLRSVALGVVLLALRTRACDVCNGVAARKVASGETLEISDEGLARLAPAHQLLVLLLYKPYDARTQPVQRAFDDVAAALKAEGLLERCVMAQIDADAFPQAAASLHVESVELPTIRIVRGDSSFGYPLRTLAAAEIASRLRSEIARGPSAALRLAPAELEELERDHRTRVVANVSHAASMRAVEHVAHALHDAVRVALPVAAPSIPSLRDATEPPCAPPPPLTSSALSAAVPPASLTASTAAASERILLLREASADFAGEQAALEMPTHFAEVAGEAPAAVPTQCGSGSGLSARALYRWVRWAALPSVFALSSESAATFLVEGASGVVFLPGILTSNRTRDFVVRRLRRVAERMRVEGEHGVWLLWADRHDGTHARLRAQLGLADVSSAPSSPATGSGGGGKEGEFAIIVMASGRILHRFVMPPPFSFDHVHAFASSFAKGELLAAQTRAQALLRLGLAAAVLVVVIGGAPLWRWLWRWCCRGAPLRMSSLDDGVAQPRGDASRRPKQD